MAPLPPRPKSDTSTDENNVPAKQHEAHLSERTLEEQQAGREALKLSNEKYDAEVEAGRKMVELNALRASKR